MPDDHSKLVPLLPIPNRTVKRLRADDSAGSRVKVGHRPAPTAKNAQPSGWARFSTLQASFEKNVKSVCSAAQSCATLQGFADHSKQDKLAGRLGCQGL